MGLKNVEILIIDDDASQIALVSKILTNLGAKVTFATNIEEGIQAIEQCPPHLLLLDIQLEYQNGLTLLEEKGEWIKNHGITIIMFSFFRDKDTVSRALTLGVDDYLVKPFSAKQLIQKVRKSVLKNTTPSYTFLNPPLIKCIFKGELTEFNEFKFVLDSPVKIEHDTELNISNPIFEGKDTISLKLITGKHSFYSERGIYKNNINIIGASEDFLKRLHRLKSARD